jgi:hypothetical protein
VSEEASSRRTRILAELYPDGDDGELGMDRLGDVCVQVTGVSGAGVMLMTEDISHGSVATTDAVSTLIEDLQFTLGEGPCLDAYREDRPVLEPDLARPATLRWAAFTPPAVEAGARAVFGFPLQVGTVRLGALNLYCNQPHALSDDQFADALVMADVTAQALLIMQAHAPPGQLAAELDAATDLRWVVHQASGMVAAQLDVGVAQALIRLRGHAFSEGRRLDDIAQDVIDRRLRFPPENET